MARRSLFRRDAPDPPLSRATSVTAAGRRIKLGPQGKTDLASINRSWTRDQQLAWSYRRLGEVRFATQYNADIISKVILYPARRDENGKPKRITDDLPVSSLERLRDPLNGHGKLLGRTATHLQFVGECFCVGIDARADSLETWDIVSRDEFQVDGDTVTLRRNPTNNVVTKLTEVDFFARLWTPDPRWGDLPDAPMFGVLSVCRELDMLQRRVIGSLISGLAAGFLTLPDELSFGPADPTEDSGGDNQALADPFIEDLVGNINAAFSDDDDLAGQVPQVIKGDSEFLTPEKFRHFSIEKPLDQLLDVRTERALQRLAQGLNVSVETITGISGENRWAPGQVTDEDFRAHQEPLLVQILESFTTAVYRPLLMAGGMGADEAAEVFLWYEADHIFARPNKTQDSKDAHDRNVISDARLRKDLGYDESDKPSKEELDRRREDKMAGRQLTSPQVGSQPKPTDPPKAPKPGPATNVPDTKTASASPATTNGNGHSITLAPSLTSNNHHSDLGSRLYAIDQSLRERLEVACDAALRRALEKAGSRIRSKAQKDKAVYATVSNVPLHEVGSLLGPNIVSQLGLTPDNLLSDSFDSLKSQFDLWTSSAQTSAASLCDLTYTAHLEATDSEARQLAWRWLRVELTKIAGDRLYSFTASHPPQGEVGPGLLIPYGVIRKAVTLAGGYDGGLLSGLACGRTIREAFEAAGGRMGGWVWSYGPRDRTRDFAPHLHLDGTVIASATDPVLVNTDTWPPVSHFTPGDDDGAGSGSCRCGLVPRMVVPVGATT